MALNLSLNALCGRRGTSVALRLACAVVGFGLFVGALGIMKGGAAALIPALQGSSFTDNA